MHRSYEWIIWLNQVDFFVRSRMGWNLKKQTNKKTHQKTKPKRQQNKLHWTNTRIFEECFLLKEKLVVW